MIRDAATDEDFRREVCDWLRANNIDPRVVPVEPNLSVADGRITLLCKVQRDGRDVIAPNGYEVLTETVTVPLLVAPEGDVAEWVRPRCPTCGR
jgi:hypothetical protein